MAYALNLIIFAYHHEYGRAVMVLARSLIDLTYNYSAKDLLSVVQESFASLAGGKEWIERRI
jgi:hypothetical protein